VFARASLASSCWGRRAAQATVAVAVAVAAVAVAGPALLGRSRVRGGAGRGSEWTHELQPRELFQEGLFQCKLIALLRCTALGRVLISQMVRGAAPWTVDVIAIGQHLFALVFTYDACADLRANRTRPYSFLPAPSLHWYATESQRRVPWFPCAPLPKHTLNDLVPIVECNTYLSILCLLQQRFLFLRSTSNCRSLLNRVYCICDMALQTKKPSKPIFKTASPFTETKWLVLNFALLCIRTKALQANRIA
jgi:hypothetical protein